MSAHTEALGGAPQRPPSAYSRLCSGLSQASLMVSVLLLIAVVLCVQWQVVGRYLLNDTPTWAEALALLLVFYLTALSVAVGVREASHIGLESLVGLLPAAWRRRVEVLIHVLVAVFGGFMVHAGWLWTTLKWNERMPMLGISEGMGYLPLLIAGALIVLFSIEHIIALLRGAE